MTTSASSDATRVEKIEGRWTLQILLCLNAGELRFSDLRTAIPGISPNVLTDRIRALQAAGLVERHYLPPPTARHLYALGPLAVTCNAGAIHTRHKRVANGRGLSCA